MTASPETLVLGKWKQGGPWDLLVGQSTSHTHTHTSLTYMYTHTLVRTRLPVRIDMYIL